jgi:hypothetical protein
MTSAEISVREYVVAAAQFRMARVSGLDRCSSSDCQHLRLQHICGGLNCAHPDCNCPTFEREGEL